MPWLCQGQTSHREKIEQPRMERAGEVPWERGAEAADMESFYNIVSAQITTGSEWTSVNSVGNINMGYHLDRQDAVSKI